MRSRHSCRAAPSGAGPVFSLRPFLLVIVLPVSAMACTSPVPELEFEYSLVSDGGDTVRIPSAVESGHTEITVRRTFTAAGPCRTLEADLVRPDPNRLVLRVAAMRGDPECDDRGRLFAYTAVIRGLREGRYNLQVVHSTFDNGRRSFETVLDHPVQASP